VQQGTRDLNQRTLQHLQKGKKMAVAKKRKLKKVIKGLNKASKLHAGQAKTLKTLLKNGKKKR